MRRYLKLLILCLIMFALPFKGMAVASVALGEPVHDHAAHGSTHAEHGHDRDEQHDAVRDVQQLSSAASSTIGQQTSGSLDQTGCTTCGAHAVAGSPSGLAIAFLRASSIAIPFLSSAYVGILTDALERPPKAIFA